MGKITAVCISREKGTPKENIGACEMLENYGLKGDAHAGSRRQVSLLSLERVREAEEKLRESSEKPVIKLKPGIFCENILAEGIDFKSYPLGTIFEIGECRLVLIQIGKKCHSGCTVRNLTGKCIMPTEGVFAKVLHGGTVKAGDEIKVAEKRMFTAAVLVASDRSSRGEREDLSGPAAVSILEQAGYMVLENSLLPDEKEELEKKLKSICDELRPDVLFTSGGTGLSPRDCMPEATLAVAEKNVPGIAEAIRAYSMTITKKAMLSRAVSVMRGRTLIINLPGSPKAVKECLDYILPVLEHGIEIMRGEGDN